MAGQLVVRLVISKTVDQLETLRNFFFAQAFRAVETSDRCLHAAGPDGTPVLGHLDVCLRHDASRAVLERTGELSNLERFKAVDAVLLCRRDVDDRHVRTTNALKGENPDLLPRSHKITLSP